MSNVRATTVVRALDKLHLTLFKCGREPNQYHGTFVHEAFRLCERSAFPLPVDTFLANAIPLNAIAEAVRLGVLIVLVVDGGAT